MPRIFENIRICGPHDFEYSAPERWGVARFGGQQNVTSKTGPWGPQQPYLEQGFGDAASLLNNPSSFVSPFTSQQQQALQGMYSLGANNPLTQTTANFSNNLLSGKYLENPSNDALAKSVMSEVLPKVESQFASSGNTNNPNMAYAAAQGATSALAPIQYQNYQQGIDQMTRGLALAPQTQQMQYGDLAQLFGAGQVQQQQNQQELSSPYTKLNQFIAEIAGNYGGTQTQPYYSNPFGQILGDAAGIGSLFAMFSDDRLKEDVELRSRRADGLGIYRFRYSGLPQKYEGVLASEVERLYPEAIATHKGYRLVNYDMIGAEMRMVA